MLTIGTYRTCQTVPVDTAAKAHALAMAYLREDEDDGSDLPAGTVVYVRPSKTRIGMVSMYGHPSLGLGVWPDRWPELAASLERTP